MIVEPSWTTCTHSTWCT